jgi:hopanoid-associated phosphorylase
MVIVAGMGPERARAAAGQLVGMGARALVSWGTCGALDRAFTTGTAVVPCCSVSDGESLPCDRVWHAAVVDALGRTSIHLSTGPVLSVPAPVASPLEKQRLGEAFGAVAVDMESHAVAAVAAAAGLPFLVLRTVVDRLDRGLPAAALAAIQPDGRVDLRRLVEALARRPQDVLAMIGVGMAFRIACRTLRRLAVALGPGLASNAITARHGDDG